MLITLPSGLSGEIRGMKGKEAQALADHALLRSGQSIEMMLKACFVSITDPGPYKGFEVGGKPNWLDVLLGDRFQALLEIRGATWGQGYDFTVQCGGCRETYEWELELSELPRKPFPDSTVMQIATGKNIFQCAAEEIGAEVSFRLATGADEHAIAKMRKQNGNRWGIVDALTQQIRSVTVDGKTLENARAIRGWLDELDLMPLRALQDQMQEPDGGIENAIETECPSCRLVQEVQLPFQGSFFFPTRKKKQINL